jgi:hypothetical protein
MSLFNWIRDGVRQAVLLGVSDAVQNLGTAPDGSDMNQRLLDVIRSGNVDAGGVATLTAEPRRKKLGRSLTDIQAERHRGNG